MAKEIWKDIPGYEGMYQVSDQGRVKSFFRKGRILRPGCNTKQGHVTVSLGRNNSINVHRLVLLTFVGPCPEGKEVRHLNGKAGDNRLSNLKYGTRSENNKDMVHHGRRRVSVSDISEIKRRLRTGEPARTIARDFHLSKSAVRAIGNRVYYVDV